MLEPASPRIHSAPALWTPRLTLHAHGSRDAEGCAAPWADPELLLASGDPALDAQRGRLRWGESLEGWAARGPGFWALRERASGRCVGALGFRGRRPALQHLLRDAPELGWVLAAWAQGRGYATEAMRAVLAWADLQSGCRRTVCALHADDVPSIRVVQRCGYHAYALCTYGGEPHTLFERWPPGSRPLGAR